ncbi:MAG TPA: hypothetical protein PLD20_17180 [Blastocatellia bacterium]|nr:hypothetical protein [Blastocatellia bacterium]HMV84346.1 hypothetical protein [Blastocatellia bacterium]HMX26958.1 hypothetical protein [Blastocatellia bacterium]HMY77042.1 hypothetical protein [Blastocatellia bacterium]HMZ19672.1 hypothetical protein [Blastocatellia bacterium]
MGLLCLFLGVIVGIMFLMALGARGVMEEKRKEAELEAAEKETEN